MVNTFPYWIEDIGSGYNIWTKISVPVNGETTIYVQKTDGYSPDGDSVFEFFDDFDGTTSFDLWATSGWSLLNGEYVGDGTSPYNNNQYVISDGIVTTKLRIPQSFGGRVGTGVFARTDGTSGCGYCAVIGYYNTKLNIFEGGVGRLVSGTYDYQVNTPYIIEFTLSGSSLTAKSYDTSYTPIETISVSDPTRNNGNIALWNCENTGNFDYIFVRKYADQEPTTVVEQIDDTTWKITITNNNDYDLVDYQVKIPGDGIVSSTVDSLLITDSNPYGYWIDSNLNIWIPVDLQPGETKQIFLVPDNTKIPNSYFMKNYYKTAIDTTKFTVNSDFVADTRGVTINTGNATANYTVDVKIVEIKFENTEFDTTKNVPLIKLGNDILVKYNSGNLDFYLDYSTSPDTVTLHQACDYLLGWKYTKDVTISNSNSTDLLDFQVKIELDSTNFDFSKCQPNGEDIRIVYDGQKLPYWIELWDATNGKAIIWTKVPSIPANESITVQLYYGNSSAVSEEDGNSVFEFFDDFETNNGWTIDSGGTTLFGVNGTWLRIYDDDGVYHYAYKDIGLQPGQVVEYKWKIPTATQLSVITYYLQDSSFSGTYQNEQHNSAEGAGLGGNYEKIYYESLQYPLLSTSIYKSIISIASDLTTTKTTYEIGNEANSVSMQTTNTQNLGGYWKFRVGFGNNYVCDFYVDYLFTRKYVDQEPTCMIGTEQIISTNTIHTMTFDLSNGTKILLDDNTVYEDTTRTYTGLNTITIGDETGGNVGIKFYDLKVRTPVPDYTVTSLEKNI